jgi:zinc protease
MQIYLFLVLVTGLLLAQDRAPKPVVEKDQLQQGKELLQRAQRAMGGAEKLAAVKDAMHKTEIALERTAGGFKLKQTTLFVAPDHIRYEQEIQSGKYIFYSDGKAGWESTPQGMQPMPADVLRLMKGLIFRQTATLLLSDRDASRQVKAIGDNAVEITTADGMSVRLEFDPSTGLLARQLYTETSANGSPRERVEELSDWRDVGGVKMYFKGAQRENGVKMLELVVSEWKINSGLTTERLSRKP